jgi:hypothetical protein
MGIELVAGGSVGSSLTGRGSLCGGVDGRCSRTGSGSSICELRLGDSGGWCADAGRSIVDERINIIAVGSGRSGCGDVGS